MAAPAGGGGGGAAPADLFYGRGPYICNPHTAASFGTIHSAIARLPRRILSIYGDVLHDQTTNVNVNLGDDQTFVSQLSAFFPAAAADAAASEIDRMTTETFNPSKYVLDRGKTHPWNEQVVELASCDNDDLSELLNNMMTSGIQKINIDCATFNLFEHGLGDPRLTRILYITNKFDAASNLGAGNLHGARNLENNDPVTIELLPGYFFRFSIIAAGGAGAADSYTNRVEITNGADINIDLRCNGPYSLGAINQFLELPPKRGVAKPRSTVVAVVNDTYRSNATAAEFNAHQKFLVMCVKEITDWGLAYKNSEINFLNRAEGTCALASFDTYFLDMMGEICGYSLYIGPKITKLLCYAKCLTTAAGVNPISNIYDNIVADAGIAGIYATSIASIDARTAMLSPGNIFGFLEILDLLYYKRKIQDWYASYSILAGMTVGRDKATVIANAAFIAGANQFSELTFLRGSRYIQNLTSEALDRQTSIYPVLYNKLEDNSESDVDRGKAGVIGMIETIDTFINEKFKGYDGIEVHAERTRQIDKLRAILYSYLRSKVITHPSIIGTILENCDRSLREIFGQACLVHYALDRSGIPTNIGIATFFLNVDATGAANKINTSTSRGKPEVDENPDIFVGTYASDILRSGIGTRISFIPYTHIVFPRKRGLNAYQRLPKTPAGRSRTIGKVRAIAKSIRREIEAAEEGTGGGGPVKSRAAERLARLKGLKKKGGYYARGGGELTEETPVDEENVPLADYDDYCVLEAVSENAASKINEILDKYRRGELTGQVIRQNPDINEFIKSTLSKQSTSVGIITSILELLLMLSDEAENNKSYYEYITVVWELIKLCEVYFMGGQEKIDIDDLMNQILYVLFWRPYTSIIFESCVNSSDISIIVNMLDTAYKMEVTSEEPTGYVVGGRVAAANLPANSTPAEINAYIERKRANLDSVRGNEEARKPVLANLGAALRLREQALRGSSPKPTTVAAPKPPQGYGKIHGFANLPKEPPLPAGAQLALTGKLAGGARRSRRRRSTPRRITRNSRRNHVSVPHASRRRRTIRRRK